jgi:hypothetical protein
MQHILEAGTSKNRTKGHMLAFDPVEGLRAGFGARGTVEKPAGLG